VVALVFCIIFFLVGWFFYVQDSGHVPNFWRLIPSPIRRFFRTLGESYWRLLLFFLGLVTVVWGSSVQMWGVWILVLVPAGILLSENSAKVKVGLRTIGVTVGTAIKNIMLVLGFLAAVGLLVWIVGTVLEDFDDWAHDDYIYDYNFEGEESDRGWWIELDPGSEDRCIGDCNDMDNDGRTWNDVDRDGDGLYESNP
jgi:hypothetical protein